MKKCNGRSRQFIGTTIKQMENYVKLITQDDKPEVVILHIEFDDISNKSMSADDIAEGIINDER